MESRSFGFGKGTGWPDAAGEDARRTAAGTATLIYHISARTGEFDGIKVKGSGQECPLYTRIDFTEN